MPWHPTLINSEILSVHAALLPVGARGTVLMFGGSEHNGAQGGRDDAPAVPANVDRTALYDIASRAVTRTTSPTTDVFCAGHAFLGDGRLLLAGGTESWGGEEGGGPGGGHGHQHGNFGGHQACWVYNHHRNPPWARAADLGFRTGPGRGGGRWYPSVVTLPSGDLAAFGGHPSRRSENWHENDTPERYSTAGGYWGWYPNAVPFEHPSLPGNWYPRVSLVRGGWLFFTTRHNNQCRFFDPNTGSLVGPVVGPPPPDYRVGWDYAVILLPLVPGDGYRARVLAVNGAAPAMIDLNLGGGTPAWGPAGARQGSAAGRRRTYACPVYLPTGQVIVTGGIDGTADAAAVKTPEVYTPDIEWAEGVYNPGQGSWQTLEGAGDAAQVARNYHSVALLLPDGSVFTAGSSKNGDPGDPAVVGQRNIELFFPPYFDDPGRPEIAAAPAVLSYAHTAFDLALASAAQAASIRKVALVRCGSVTHASDFDQRYVALRFAHEPGTPALRATFPNDPSVVPPGHYMLWAVDQNELPCRLARFVRVAHQGCTVVTDRSTFSREEVEALGGGGGQATFENALYVQFDGFIHTEITGAPGFRVRWADSGADVPASDVTLLPGARLQEVNPGFADTPQRITFAFHVRFNGLDAYAGFTDTRQLRVTFTHGVHACSQTLDLTHAPNPYMLDISPAENNPAWLSTDVRVFSIEAGQSKFGDVFQDADNPIPLIRRCLDRLNGGAASFDGLSTSATLDLASSGPFPALRPLFNYAIARVRYRAKTTTAQRVKCFFRMFNVAATGLEFDPNTTYRRTPAGPGTAPLLGVAGGEVVSVPFFASPRVETVQGRPGATSMASQALDPVYEVRDIAPNPSGAEVTAYFGCWLDINRDTRRIPIAPGGSDGPWPEVACRSIQELARGRHLCLVAEVFFEPDPTQPGETPGTSDNLSQRNLAILHSDNPGGPDSRTVVHGFEVKPSLGPLGPQLLQAVPGSLAFPSDNTPGLAAGRRLRLDELLFRWHNLPPDSKVTVYFSDIDTAVIRALAAFRRSPLPCEVVDQRTLRFAVAGATWVPIPGGRTLHIPALLGVELPPGVVAGQEFRVSIHQVEGRSGRVIGACDFRIRVSKAALILPEAVRTLSVFKHIASTIPADNRWHPLMLRYLHHLGAQVDALGGDSRGVHGNPDGSGRPYEPPGAEGRPDLCRLLECLLGAKGVEELLRHHGIRAEELRRCLGEYCGGRGPGRPLPAGPAPLADRLRPILGDGTLLKGVMDEIAREERPTGA